MDIEFIHQTIHNAYENICKQLKCTPKSPIPIEVLQTLTEIFRENNKEFPKEMEGIIWEIQTKQQKNKFS